MQGDRQGASRAGKETDREKQNRQRERERETGMIRHGQRKQTGKDKQTDMDSNQEKTQMTEKQTGRKADRYVEGDIQEGGDRQEETDIG